MCLYTDQKTPTIATCDIFVYKVLRVTKPHCSSITSLRIEIVSPYLYSVWNLGTYRKATMRPVYCRSSCDPASYMIEQGLHAFTSFPKADAFANHRSTFVFIAKIPKGAQYYRGVYDDIVANKMVVLDRNHPESLKRLRITKWVPLGR